MYNMLTPFGKEISKVCPLSEYPRPQLVRDNYTMLNGIWQYAIKNINLSFDGQYKGEILVPFSPETRLSGVEEMVGPDDVLYYKREFYYTKSTDKARVLLHFDAVDYIAEVTLNDKVVAKHKGGYLPFVIDVTDVIEDKNTLLVKVTDPSDTLPQQRGKQRLKRGGIFYTAQSGIWQSVWLEDVVENYVERLRLTPNIDTKTLAIEIFTKNEIANGYVNVSLRGKNILSKQFVGNELVLEFDDIELWSPENPTLYDLEFEVDGDKFTSYFAMRKFSIAVDKNGYPRINLNNLPYFNNGLLDQGYWSDGLLTPPSDEAMIYDIKTMKEMGFNMLRKHIKIEPLRWYYHCDRLGMIVWQDFVNGGGNYDMIRMGAAGLIHLKVDDNKYWFYSRSNSAGRTEYLHNIEPTINHLYNIPSIAVWVPFNEGWGQFDSELVVDKIKSFDNTRLIDHASGWVDQGIADFRSLHIYWRKVNLPKDHRCIILSEFGGYSMPIEKHYIPNKKAFGYKFLKSKEQLLENLQKLYKRDIEGNIKKGLSAAVYTQVSDVEDEINGLLTFDRVVNKVDIEEMKKINNSVYAEFDKIVK